MRLLAGQLLVAVCHCYASLQNTSSAPRTHLLPLLFGQAVTSAAVAQWVRTTVDNAIVNSSVAGNLSVSAVVNASDVTQLAALAEETARAAVSTAVLERLQVHAVDPGAVAESDEDEVEPLARLRRTREPKCDAKHGALRCWELGCTRECASQTVFHFSAYLLVCLGSHSFARLMAPLKLPMITLFITFGILAGPFGFELVPRLSVGRLR